MIVLRPSRGSIFIRNHFPRADALGYILPSLRGYGISYRHALRASRAATFRVHRTASLDLLVSHVRVFACDYYFGAPRFPDKETSALRSRPYQPKLVSYLIRSVLAAMLALALLAGVAPFASFSSADTCTMSCCAGKPPHEAGSCSTAFNGTKQAEMDGEAIHVHEAQSDAGGMRVASAEIVEASTHCGTTQHSSESGAPDAAAAPPQTTNVAAHVLTTPCSPECAAALAYSSAQVRRPRNAATLASNTRPRPPTLVLSAEPLCEAQSSSAAVRRQSRPRAPPTPAC